MPTSRMTSRGDAALATAGKASANAAVRSAVRSGRPDMASSHLPAPWMVPDDVKSVNYRTVPPFRAAPARYDRPIQPDVRLRRMRRASSIVAKAVIVLAAILAAADAAAQTFHG